MHKLHPAVKAIVQRGKKFLVIKQEISGRTLWSLPGGKVKFRESPYDALIREVMEEVHLPIKIIKPLGIFWFFRDDDSQVICTTFICTTNSYDIDLTKSPANENIAEYRWVTKKEFLGSQYTVGHNSMKELIAQL